MWTEVGSGKCFYKDISIDVKCSGASELFLGFICNYLSYFTTAKITFTYIRIVCCELRTEQLGRITGFSLLINSCAGNDCLESSGDRRVITGGGGGGTVAVVYLWGHRAHSPCLRN